MSLKILKTGILTTFQDAGRKGFAQFGVNPGGVMDWFSSKILNIILGNNLNEGVLEIHYPAAVFQFNASARFAITGADFDARINEKSIQINQTYVAKEGDILRFLSKKQGERAYFSIEGGFETESWLGSVSPNLAVGFGVSAIVNNTNLRFKKYDFKSTKIHVSSYVYPQKTTLIRYISSDLLTQDLSFQAFVIKPNSNRMGLRLESYPIETQGSILSTAVNFGTIQILPSGQLIILMADHQTSGGYPILGNIILADLPILAQLTYNQNFNLIKCSIEEAENAYFELNINLQKLKASVDFNAKQ